jgi:hypothetical protein
MNLPFTIDQFLGVFISYNTSIWPVQIALNALALVARWLHRGDQPRHHGRPGLLLAGVMGAILLGLRKDVARTGVA